MILTHSEDFFFFWTVLCKDVKCSTKKKVGKIENIIKILPMIFVRRIT